MIHSDRFARRCREIGEEILERARAAQPRFWQRAWWQEQATRFTERDERLKVQLFRFIDVLPALRNDREVVRHLREYLDPQKLPLPLPLRFALDFEELRAGKRLPLRAVAAARLARTAAAMMARRFITGSQAEEALHTLLAMRSRGLAFTLDLLGEATTSDAQADAHAGIYLHLLEALAPAARRWPEAPQIDRTTAGPQPRVNISVKLSALYAQVNGLEPHRFMNDVTARLRPILRRARQLGAFINIDMESYAWRDLTLHVFKQLLLEAEFRDWPHVGIVVQAYLRDSEADLHGLLDWTRRRGTPIAIRLVKGAYWDYETTLALQKDKSPPVWTRKWESDAQYERLAAILLESHAVRPAFASHNVRSLAAALATAEDLGLTPGDYEIQMLYGMGDPLEAAIAGMGRCVRVYAPYGELLPGMAYLIRRLLENTSNDSFLRQSFGERASYDRLLTDPAIARPPSAPLPHRRYQETDEDVPMIDFTHAAETDFTDAANREKMLGALKYVRGEFGHEYPLWIDNQPVHTPQHAESRNPAAPEEAIGRSALADAKHVQQALAAARRAWRDWHRLSAAERATPLRKAVQSITARRLELAATLVLEGGRPWCEADREVARSIDLLNYYCAAMEALEARPRRRDLPGESNVFSYGARGVVALAAAGDFALWQPAAALAAALVAGNTVVVESSAARGMIAAKLVTLLIEAGLPPGTLALLSTAGRDVAGHALLENGFAFDLFHDCAAPARSINTVIVDDDADLDQAVGGVIESAFECAGQRMDRCMRVVIAAPVYAPFCQRLAETARGLVVGPPEDPATLLIGPMVDAAARERTRALIEQGRRAARVLVEFSAQQVPGAGYYVGPVILSDVSPSSAFARQPLFGPLLLLMSAPDFESALELANDAGPALTGGVYSRSPAHIDLARREWRAANVFINRKITGFRVDVQPLGRERLGGLDYLLKFVETRSISENTLRHGLAAVEELASGGVHPRRAAGSATHP